MPAFPYRPYRLASRLGLMLLAGLAAGVLSGCGTFNRVASVITPYKVSVVQGNFVSREQAQQLQPGMSRLQVRDIIGSPLVASAFHADRWDYVFTLRRQGLPDQSYRLTAFFKGDLLERFESDTLPTESEFVATVDNRANARAKTPALEASEAQLARYPVPAPAAAPAPLPPLPTSYPPLEPAAR